MERYVSFTGLVLVTILLSLGQKEADCLKMQMKMIHRHSPHSPVYREFASRHERLQELLHLDSVRIRSTHWAKNNMSMDSEPAAAPSPATTPFYMELTSGATLGAALYFVELYIGTPPQRVLLVADTGSDLIWVNCNGNGRSRTNITGFPVFSPDNSSTLSYVPCYSRDCYAVSPDLGCIFRPKRACRYSYGYLDNSSTSGPYIQETITLVSSPGHPFKAQNIFMGCGMNNQGQSQVGSGGVLGLGQGFNSFATQTSRFYGSTFSYCLSDYLQPTTLKTSLFFGERIENPTSSLQQSLQYTPILKGKSSFYYVGVEDVTVNGESLPISSSLWEMDEAGNGGTIIDSGTSLTYFVEEAYEIVMEALRVSTGYPIVTTKSPQRFDLCFNVSGISNPKFPEISIVLKGGIRFTPSESNYMLDIEDGVRCVGFNPLGSQSIIGNLLQQNFFIEYDRRRSLLGFAPANCSLITG
ncbi:hypothetical protein SUGI_0492640 [Cryptomeria japonica]|uniref:aspartic proteinase NANA, chloroplast n=1 Tax=Cryptomeria japonica TaxID=3369 RepID=UPI002408E966|nr:aspartic proteinase NANA, chloroplast [Cryptomeria japonica]XP_057833248.2 aspartic proteinase NANA, chloroplast [Cryptomeria japonica]GLJ25733.1 hypothetical protein SUGI_0492640 [Cryptomeria japonica]